MSEHQFEDAMKARVEEKQEEYGDIWKTIGIGFLRHRVSENYAEWIDTSKNDSSRRTEMRKLVDLANLCKFLWTRLEGENTG